MVLFSLMANTFWKSEETLTDGTETEKIDFQTTTVRNSFDERVGRRHREPGRLWDSCLRSD